MLLASRLVAPPSRPHASLAALKALIDGLPAVAPTFAVVALLACVLLPLPTPLVDILLSMSLAGAVLLMVASVTVRRTTDFIGFPALLLLATLYRLALNISTTRLILSQAYAGEVIDAFAGIVVRGDLIVGGVMFVLITIVQFVVIARGAERVAEVGARFALDGLPGHQAAIDADLRAGVISPSEAARRRAELVERSNFYGAMDGTVRFVRGDAVAGLAITGVNLLGGVLVGLTRQGMSWSDSLDVFGRLTVGDGLLSQIPAVLVSLAAGILVARVDRADTEQRTRLLDGWLVPSMLLVPVVMLVVLALAPGMPRLAFALTAFGLLAVAWAQALRRVVEDEAQVPAEHTRQLTVHLHATDVGEARPLERALAEVRLQCASALGLPIPPVRLVLRDTGERGLVEVRLEGRSLGRSALAPDRSIDDQVVIAVFRLVMDGAPSLLDLEDIDRMIDSVRATHPVIVRRALETVDLTDVLAVARGFLAERVPLPPLRFVLGALAEGERFRDPQERPFFSELLRLRLADHWVRPVLDGLRALGPVRVLKLTPDAESELMDAVVRGRDGLRIELYPRERERWRRALSGEAERLEAADRRKSPIVLVASPKARPAAAMVAAGSIPHVPVLSTAELARAGEQLEAQWLDAPVADEQDGF